MTEKLNELLEAAKALLQYLEASTDHRDELRSVRKMTIEECIAQGEVARTESEVSPAEKLRRRASEIEAKDAAINRFRVAVTKLETEHATDAQG